MGIILYVFLWTYLTTDSAVGLIRKRGKQEKQILDYV